MSAADAPEPKRPLLKSSVTVTLVTIVSFAIVGLIIFIGNEQDEKGPADATLTAKQVEGRKLFNQNCSQCHALDQVNAIQTVGPDLDALKPPKALVLDAINNGRARGQGNMPDKLVTGEDADAVAEYVAAVAGKKD